MKRTHDCRGCFDGCDVVLQFEETRELRLLQLTDMQFIDSEQRRTPDRLSTREIEEWLPEKFALQCGNQMRALVERAKPDLIFITGDLIYGSFDDSGSTLEWFCRLMDSFKIPWAPVFGNHDNESMMGVAWQCQQLENAENCLFKRNSLETGNGNYTVGICGKDGNLQRVFFMMDSNGCGAASVTSMDDGQIRTANGFGKKQLKWLEDEVEKVQSKAKKAKLSLAFHIQTWEFENAFQRYGYLQGTTQSAPINIDLHPNKQQGDFGYVGRDLKGAWREDRLAALLSKDVIDSVFVGHEHCNNASVVFEGVRYQYGQKCSEYDRKNYLCKDGTIVGSYSEQLPPLMGGTVFSISKDSGEIVNPHVYLCDTWSNFVWGE